MCNILLFYTVLDNVLLILHLEILNTDLEIMRNEMLKPDDAKTDE